MNASGSAPRRFAALVVLALALLVPFAAALFAAPSADAIPGPCDIDCSPPITYYSTITVTAPSLGSVVATNDSDTRTITCSVSNGTCLLRDSQESDTGRPVDGWPTWTFSYSGPGGYAVSWSGACTGMVACTVTDDGSSSQAITATSHDVEAPSVSLTAPDRITPSTALIGSATDNSGTISSEEWIVCNSQATGCVSKSQGTNDTTFLLADEAAGTYVVRYLAKDGSGNENWFQKTVTLVTGLTMTSSGLPSLSGGSTVTMQFSSDDEDHTTRQCRVYPTGTPAPDWGPCTLKNYFTVTQTDGDWTLEAKEVDDLGYVATVSETTSIDTTAPSVTIAAGPAEGATVTTRTMRLAVNATDAHLQSVTCALDNATATPCDQVTTLSGYADGAHTVTVTATDELGHVTTVVRHFSVVVATTTKGQSVVNTYGTAATLVATVTPASATGTVTFTLDGKPLCRARISKGRASCAAPRTLAAGTHAITAAYQGDYAPSSAKFTLTTRKRATAISTSMAKTVKRGSKSVVRVRLLPKAATGTVTVANGTAKLCSAKVHNGSAVCAFTVKLAKGTHALTVRYGGATDYATSTRTVKVKVV